MTGPLELLALVASAAYVGAAGYVALVEQPSRLACADEIAWRQWVQSVKRTPRYAASALIAAGAGLIHGRLALASFWTWGSVLLLAIVPFTLLTMLPAQRRLTAGDWNPASGETRAMLTQWGRQHVVRSLLGLAALFLFFWAAALQS
jgi:hypothetical protein